MSDRLALVLARAVRAERARRGLSQSELGQALGWSQTKVAGVEAGTRRLLTHEMPELCEALGVTLARLLTEADPEDVRRLGL